MDIMKQVMQLAGMALPILAGVVGLNLVLSFFSINAIGSIVAMLTAGWAGLLVGLVMLAFALTNYGLLKGNLAVKP